MDDNNERLIAQEITRELGERVISYRNEFVNFFSKRFMESLVTLFNYNVELPFDRNILEYGLRNNYGMVFGKNRLNQDVILGYVRPAIGSGAINNNIGTMFEKRLYTGADIKYIIPEYLRPVGKTREIYYYDKGATGDFVVFWNKPVNLINDYKIIKHYTNSLAEIVASRYSLIIQAKVQTVGIGDYGDETIKQFFAALYNGQPFIQTDKWFDVDDNIKTFDNTNLSQNLSELKTEYQNQIAELNAIFGTNILAVNKDSGVNDSEANGNLGFVNNNLAIWLKSRQQSLDLYNTRFHTNYSVSMSDAKQGLLAKKDNESGDVDEDNNTVN